MIDIAESYQALRLVAPIGISLPFRVSAAGRSVVAHFRSEERETLLGAALSDELAAKLQQIASTSHCVMHDSDPDGGVSISSAVLDSHG